MEGKAATPWTPSLGRRGDCRAGEGSRSVGTRWVTCRALRLVRRLREDSRWRRRSKEPAYLVIPCRGPEGGGVGKAPGETVPKCESHRRPRSQGSSMTLCFGAGTLLLQGGSRAALSLASGLGTPSPHAAHFRPTAVHQAPLCPFFMPLLPLEGFPTCARPPLDDPGLALLCGPCPGGGA